MPAEFYRSILMDGKGSFWAVGERHVIELPRDGQSFIDRTSPAFASRQRLLVDAAGGGIRQGRVLISIPGGVARWDGSQWQRIGEAQGLRSSHVTTMLFGPQGDLWMGSTGHGLQRWTGYNDWEGWSESTGLPSANIWSVGLFDHGKTYVGTEMGPASIDLKTGTARSLFTQPRWTYGQVTGLVEDHEGAIWAGTQSGTILRIQPETRKVTEIAKLDAFIYSVVPDPSGRAFFLTDHGIFRSDRLDSTPKKRVLKEVNALFKSAPIVYGGCAARDGSDWFVARNGVFQFKDELWKRPSIVGLPSPLPTLRNIALRRRRDALAHGRRDRYLASFGAGRPSGSR